MLWEIIYLKYSESLTTSSFTLIINFFKCIIISVDACSFKFLEMLICCIYTKPVFCGSRSFCPSLMKRLHLDCGFLPCKVIYSIMLIYTRVTDKNVLLQVPGGTMRDSFLVSGVAFKKTFSYAGFEQQPKKFLNPKILLLNIELELKSEKENAEIR